MQLLEIVFWVSIAVVLYTYVGYALVVGMWTKIRSLWKVKDTAPNTFEPLVTLVIPAYNEADILEEKITNCLQLNYPADKLTIIFITDGSTDHSAEVLAQYPQIQHLHLPQRGGKAAAENRVMEYIKTAIVVFTDCNTVLNPDAVREMVKHYQNPLVGAVSGEKKILKSQSAAGTGEGAYWKYESFLKRCDSEIYSLMGAAGELVSFRTSLVTPLEADTILDDFVQSLRIVAKGYRVVYEPNAYASETASVSLAEEMKRKIRICAGGWQSMVRLKSLLNPFRQPVVTFLYVSHRVLRWSLTPLLLALLLPVNFVLSLYEGSLYTAVMLAQFGFYSLAALGWYLSQTYGKSSKLLVIPLYFSMMNIAVFRGFFRFVKKSQPAAWEKAQRSAYV